MTTESPLPDVHPKSPERRTVLKVAAWSVPAVVAVSAAPAFAASPGAPEALPAGFNYDWSTGVQVQRAGNANFWTNRSGSMVVSYDLYEADFSLVAAGTYFTDVFVTVAWNVNQPLLPTVLSADGWTLVSGDLTASSSGTLVFQSSPALLNGASNALAQPQVQLASTGTNPSSGTVTTLLDGTNLAGTSVTINV